ncbi:MAG TPA: energy transducer TonB [Gemmatimonadales bacterium]|nr:energy transducer TonB [Gemmatimonadales bacterium]HRZ09847.1 energy transducer TonB [Gemmatimonadales bacterium]
MSRPIAVRRRAPEVAAGAAGTALIHLSLLALLIGGIKTAAPMAPVYAVELVAAPLPSPSRRPAPEAVSRPVEPPDPGPPAATKSKVTPIPAPKAPPRPKSTAPKSEPSNVKREPAPRSESKVAPAPGETPSTGTDAVNIKTPGLQFAYPEYLRNIVSQVYRRWERPGGNQALRAEVSFFILRDGSVRDIRFVTPSGNFSFDLSAQGAIEAAGNAKAFGPLPDGYEADVLPVSFFFTPRSGS